MGRRGPAPDKGRCEFLAGHLNELLNEPDWNDTASGIVACLEQRVAGADRTVDRTLDRPSQSGVTATARGLSL